MAVVKSADRVVRILEAIASGDGGLTHGELSRMLGIPKGSLSSLLSNLVDRGYLAFDPLGKLYMLGSELLVLTSRYLNSLDIVRTGRPIVHGLVLEMNEDAEIAVQRGDQVVFLYKEESSRPVKYSIAPGELAPLFATSPGKCILAFMPEEDVCRVSRPGHALPHNGEQHHRPGVLRRELDADTLDRHRLRARGVSVRHLWDRRARVQHARCARRARSWPPCRRPASTRSTGPLSSRSCSRRPRCSPAGSALPGRPAVPGALSRLLRGNGGEKGGNAMTIRTRIEFHAPRRQRPPEHRLRPPDVTLAELLEEISGRSSNSLQFLSRDGKALDEGWEVEVNGCALASLPQGLGTSLQDGDRVAIKLSLLGGG